MEIQNYQEITIGSDSFQKARDNFDALLQRLFKRMEQNNSDEGSITMKVDINIITDYVPDENGKNRRVSKPILKHKISSAVPVKDDLAGKQDTGMELVYDDELGRYVLKYVSVGGQKSIFDPEYADVVDVDAEYDDADAQQGLPGNWLIGCEDAEGEQDTQNGDSGGLNEADGESIRG